MARLLVVQHLEKTVIGRIARGFDFLGYWFSPLGLAIARKTVERCLEDVSRLDEQGADVSRIGTYLVRWIAWVRGGVGCSWDGSCSLVEMPGVVALWAPDAKVKICPVTHFLFFFRMAGTIRPSNRASRWGVS